MKEMDVYDVVTHDDYRSDPEGILVGTPWVETDKGSCEDPDIRMRLCAQEFATHKDNELYAATPPLAATRLLISKAASTRPGRAPKQLMSLDVKRAFLHGLARRRIYVRLPWEDPRSEGGTKL